MARKPYPSDVSDEEWAFVAPYSCLMREDAPQRHYGLREVYHGLRYAVRAEKAWRTMPNDLPPWTVICQQARRWMDAGKFEQIAHDLRLILRVRSGRHTRPTAAVIDSRTLRSTPESGGRSGYDGYKRTKGSEVHKVVDTLGHLLTRYVTPADEQERDRVALPTQEVAAVTGENVTIPYADQGEAGHEVAEDARVNGTELVVVGMKETRKGFVLLPERWVIERTNAWASRFGRPARDHERPPEVLAGMHYAAFAILMLAQLGRILKSA